MPSAGLVNEKQSFQSPPGAPPVPRGHRQGQITLDAVAEDEVAVAADLSDCSPVTQLKQTESVVITVSVATNTFRVVLLPLAMESFSLRSGAASRPRPSPTWQNHQSSLQGK